MENETGTENDTTTEGTTVSNDTEQSSGEDVQPASEQPTPTE